MRLRFTLVVFGTVVLALVGGCEGSTIIVDDPSQAPSSTPSGSEGTQTTSPNDPDPDATGWWPPPPQPTTPSQAPSSLDSPTSEGQLEPQHPEEGGEGPTGQQEEPVSKRFTFDRWEEYIYQSRNHNPPARFEQREPFPSCGDFASEEGADLLSPDVAECLDEGQGSQGRESAIAVRLASGGVHVWFIRVGPDTTEYFVDRSHTGAQWMHAECVHGEPIGVLACDEPSTLEVDTSVDSPLSTPQDESGHPDEETSPASP